MRSALPVVLLSKLTSEREVGLFSAAQLLVPIGLVFQAIALSVFPLLCRKFAAGRREFRQVGSQLFEVLMIVGLPTAVGLFLLADSALLLLYRDADFLGAVAVLRILAWLIILNAMTTALGHLLYAASNERMTLRIVLTQVAVLLVLGIVLINSMGLLGAAVAGELLERPPALPGSDRLSGKPHPRRRRDALHVGVEATAGVWPGASTMDARSRVCGHVG